MPRTFQTSITYNTASLNTDVLQLFGIPVLCSILDGPWFTTNSEINACIPEYSNEKDNKTPQMLTRKSHDFLDCISSSWDLASHPRLEYHMNTIHQIDCLLLV